MLVKGMGIGIGKWNRMDTLDDEEEEEDRSAVKEMPPMCVAIGSRRQKNMKDDGWEGC